MKSTYDTIVACRNASGSKAKNQILTEQKDNLELQSFLRMTYEPRISYYISKVDKTLIAEGATSAANRDFSVRLMEEVYNMLAKRVISGNMARQWLATLHFDLKEDWERELLEIMINRDVKAGIAPKSINKVWPDLITVIPYMRASLPKHVELDTWPWDEGVYCQVKADGSYAAISHHEDGSVTVESRVGSVFPHDYFMDIVKEVKDNVPVGNQIQGELLIEDSRGVIQARQIGNGMLNALLQGGELDHGYRVVFQAWDKIPLQFAVSKGKYTVPYGARLSSLEMAIRDCTLIKTINYDIVYSMEEALAFSSNVMSEGGEGAIIKHPDAIWMDGTSKEVIKLKLEVDFDVKMIGLNPAEEGSRNADTFGSVEFESECGLVKSSVTGFKDEERQHIFDNWEQLEGKIMTITANGLLEPSENNEFWSVYLPRHNEIRFDKTEADTLERMQAIVASAIKG